MRAIFRELRRRNVFRAALAYLALAWLIVQIVETVFPVFGLPDEFVRWVIILLVFGFPIVVVFAWFYELTPEGVMSTEAADAAGYTEAILNRRYIDFVIIALLIVAVAWLVYERQLGPEFPEKSVAVLAFDDMSPNGDQGWFADGLTEEILNSLARLPELQVIARYSAFQFRNTTTSNSEVAARLGVKYVVLGSVRLAGDRLRISAQLIRATDGFQLWSDIYNREMQDVFAVQEDIAEHIAEALDVVLDDEKREAMFVLGTRNVDAYQYFLHGRKLLYEYLNDGQHEKMWRAKEWLEKAISADPRFAAAYALRSHAYLQFLDGVLPSPVPPAEMNDSMTAGWALEQLMSDAANVIAHAKDPGLRLVSEIVQVLFSDDWSALRRLAEQVDPTTLAAAGDVLPLHHVACALGLLHMTDKAMMLAELRIERNPLSPLPFNEAWRASNVAGDTTRAIGYLEQGLATVGKSMFLEFHMLLTHVATNNLHEAIRLAEYPDWGPPEYHSSMLAFVYAVAGRDDDARMIVESLSDSNRQDLFFALMLAATGEQAEAKRLFGAFDTRPNIQVQFVSLVTIFQGRAPWDISWTPNFAARLGEAGVTLERHVLPHAESGDGARAKDDMRN